MGASLFASNIGSGHFIGLAGSGAAAGIGAIAYEWNVRYCIRALNVKTKCHTANKIVADISAGYADGAAAGMALPAHLYRLWGEASTHIKHDVQRHDLILLIHSFIIIVFQVMTMPEYLQRRFGGRRTQLFIAVLSLFIYIFTKISV